ncbi:MAG: Rpn family recombination-promoting nuclease/putative transposase [Phormidesmis sp.]
MKTDSIFYEIFQSDPNILYELLGNPDPRVSTYSFASQEVKQTSFRFDGILIPPPDIGDLPIVFIEAQAYADRKNTLYSSFFSEIFLYLHDYQPVNDWQSVLIFTQRRLDPGIPKQYDDFEASPRFQRIYLDELGNIADLTLNMSLLKLIGEPKSAAAVAGRQLVERVCLEMSDVARRQNFVELIATTLFYKYQNTSRAEIEAMLGISDLRSTRVFKEAKEEGREEGLMKAIPLLLEGGVSMAQMAKQWNLEISTVENMAIAALTSSKTAPAQIATRLNLSLSRVQQVIQSYSREATS